MSKFKKKLGRRIMAVALSLAMIMSNMTVYANELSETSAVEAEESVVSTDEETVDKEAENEAAADVETETTDKASVSEKSSESDDNDEEQEDVKETEVTSSLDSEDEETENFKEEEKTDTEETLKAATIKSENESYGTVTSVKEGDKYNLTVEPKKGYMFSQWTVPEGVTVDATSEPNKFTVSASSVDDGSGEIVAQFETIKTSWDLAALTSSNSLTIQGKIDYLDGLLIDATEGKLGANNASWAQANILKIHVPVQGASKVTVKGYNKGTYKVDGTVSTADDQKEDTFTCTGANGWVVIEVTGNTYLATVKVEGIVIDSSFKPVSEAVDNLNINFKDLATSKTDGANIDTSANTSDAGLKYIAVKNITWHNPLGGSHGIGTAADSAMAITIPDGKKADITILGCQYGSNGVTSAIGADGKTFKIVETTAKENYTGSKDAPEYIILGAEGTVTLSFASGMWIHNLKVNYWNENVTDKYIIKATADENGTAKSSPVYAAEGDKVTLTAEPNSGYGVAEWQVIKPAGDGALTITPNVDNANSATFTMPSSDVEVKAVFEAVGASHNITVTETVEHGTVTVGTVTSAKTGVTVNMDDIATVTPNDGYILKEWDVTYAGEDGSTQKVELTKTAGKYSFIMPDADITVTAVIELKPVTYFTTTYFNQKVQSANHSQNDPVDDVDGLDVVEGTFKYWDKDHGLTVSNAKIKLTFEPGKKYDLTIWGCMYGTAISMPEDGDPKAIPETANNTEDPNKKEDNVKKYTILNVENEVTLTINSTGSFVHGIVATESSGLEKYKVTVTDDGNGTAKVDKALAEEGTEITLTATPDNRYQFKEWKVISGDVKIENNKFTMPASDVEIKAIFDPIIRRDWDFANDENLKGDKGAAVTGKTETVAGLGIDATAEGSGWDSTGTGTDGAAVKNKTIITIPVEGDACKVKVSAESAAYTVDGKAAEAAEETFDCTGSDGKVVIEITADNHIKAINVTPVMYATAGTYNFATLKDLKIDGFTFNKIEHKGNSHGCESTGDGASITLNLSGKANVTVLGCRYGVGTAVEMAATSGEVTKTIIAAESDKVPEFSIRKADAGDLTLTFNNIGETGEGTLWIHTVSIEYLPEELPDVYTEGIDVWDFGAEQLQSTDTVKYNNKLTEEIINSWFPNVAPGTTNATIASFEVKDDAGNVDFMFNDGGYPATHRLRTENKNLTRWDSKHLNIGDATYNGYLYSNKGSEKGVYVGVKLNAGDIMTAVVSSNGNAYTITVEDPEGRAQNFAKPKGASVITYYATKSGIHKIYNGTDEKLVVGRVTRQHNKTVNVSGTITRKSGVDGALTLTFTCKESGKAENVTVAEDGTYSVNLFENYHYDVVVSPAIYIIEEGGGLELGAANETQTFTHNITVGAVTLRKLSGSIVGLDDAAMNNLKISFEKPEDKLYLPTIEVDKAAKTYTALLESGVEYILVTEGVNDYELDSRANNNSDRIRISSDATGRNITYKKKPVYKVTIEPVGATLADLANATFTFTNLKEEGYVYNFTGTDNIELRDGTYSVVVSNSGVFRQKLTGNLVVDGSDVTKKIAFDSTPVTKWDFVNANTYENSVVKNPCDGLSYSGEGAWKYHGESYGSTLSNIIISVPVTGSGKVKVELGYSWGIVSGDITDSAQPDGGRKTLEIPYNNTDKVDITVGSTTTYIKSIEVIEAFEYKATITVGKDKDYQTINDALEAVRKMDRTADQAVTIAIDPGNYEEMLVIETSNIKLVNAAGENASIGLRNKGVDIDANAVRITSYYGHGYSYYSMGNDCKWSAEVLEANKENGCESYTNPGSGSTNGSYWNATVVINTSNVSAEGIIFENSFNQYISKKAAEDVIVKQSSAKEGSVPRASMAYGDTTVQDKAYVERAAALAITNGQSHISFDNCKFIGRQDTLYGGVGVTAAFYGCSVYGGTDYIFGGMRAVFAKCELVFNTSDENKNDVGYITAAQQSEGRGYLMYNCHVTSTMPGVDTASKYTSKPGYLGRPWQANTGEAVFYKTIIDEADAHWSTEGEKLSLITPVGWDKSLSDISALSQEYGTYELSGVDNSTKRVDWANVLTEEKLVSGDPITVETFLGDWDVFAGKDMTVVLPNDEGVPAPAQPKAIITPEAEKEDEVIKGASIVLSAERGAKVYYNVNADGNPTETPEMLYKGAIDVTDENIKDNKITVKAIAVKYGKTSEVAIFTYKVVEAPAPAKPVLTPETDANVLLGSSIKMSAPYGAKIYYNVNAEAAPTDKDTLYTGKLGVKLTLDMVNKEDSTVKIQAVAVMTGKTSEVTTAVYNVIVNKPVASVKNGYQFPDGGGKVKLTADEDVTILYTTGATADDAADPTLAESNPATYDKESSGITVSQDTVIKAVAKRGSKYSAVVTLEYLVPLSMPVATPESGSVLPKNGRIVRLSADEGTTIYYTIGADSDPTVESEARKTYDPDQGIEVTENNTTIKAVAVKGDRQSTVAAFTYTTSEEEFPKAETPTVTSVNGKPVTGNAVHVNAGEDVVVKLATATEGAEIYYTTDNKLPGASSNKYNDETGIAIAKIAEDTVIKAIAVKDKFLNSEPLTLTIQIGNGGGDEPVITVIDIDKCDIAVSSILADPKKNPDNMPKTSVVYYAGTDSEGKPINPVTFAAGLDYEVSKPVLKEGNVYSVTLKGLGRTVDEYRINPESSVTKTFRVFDKKADKNSIIDLSKAKITIDTKSAVYTGYAITPAVTEVKVGKDVIDAAKYKVSYRSNINTGKASVIVSADSDAICAEGEKFVIGTKTVNFTIKKAAINKADHITVTAKDANGKDLKGNEYDYRGVEAVVAEELIVKSSAGKTLRENIDYTVTYKNNRKAGKASLVIKGIGNNVSGTLNIPFTIKPIVVNPETDVYAPYYGMEYSPNGAKAQFILFRRYTNGNHTEIVDEILLEEGVDFKGSYKYASKNKEVGSTVKFSGKGMNAFKGIFSESEYIIKPSYFTDGGVYVSSAITVDITKGDLEGAALQKALEKAVVLNDYFGTKLKVNKDYVIEPTVAEDGRGAVIIRPTDATKANYAEENPLLAYYYDKAKNIAKLSKPSKVEFAKDFVKYYDGRNPVQLTAEDIKLLGSYEFELGKHVEIVPGSYKNNYKAGTASVTIRGIAKNGYYGTKTIKFKIKEA